MAPLGRDCHYYVYVKDSGLSHLVNKWYNPFFRGSQGTNAEGRKVEREEDEKVQMELHDRLEVRKDLVRDNMTNIGGESRKTT